MAQVESSFTPDIPTTRITMSSLARFILANREDILNEWQSFAATVASAKGMDRAALRDDAEQMLTRIAQDMMTAQSDKEQRAKSKGHQPAPDDAEDTAATLHGDQRFADGFDVEEMVSEFRALRASVIRLWIAKERPADEDWPYELTRFNESIDQALCESVRRFSAQLDRSRELFMGVLGHDLRTPLHIILSSAAKLMQVECAPEQQKLLGKYVHDSGQHMTSLITDLLDVVRTKLGGTLPLQREWLDATTVCRDVADQFRVLHPQRELELDASGDMRGCWDDMRLHQLLTNLLRNAFQHGDSTRRVTLSTRGDGEFVVMTVHNHGEPIPPALLAHIFEPLRHGQGQHNERDGFSMGLGLYIADTIARAHEGTLSVESTAKHGTAFTARIPRVPRNASTTA
jgi:signal transduction histidine kinase